MHRETFMRHIFNARYLERVGATKEEYFNAGAKIHLMRLVSVTLSRQYIKCAIASRRRRNEIHEYSNIYISI